MFTYGSYREHVFTEILKCNNQIAGEDYLKLVIIKIS